MMKLVDEQGAVLGVKVEGTTGGEPQFVFTDRHTPIVKGRRLTPQIAYSTFAKGKFAEQKVEIISCMSEDACAGMRARMGLAAPFFKGVIPLLEKAPAVFESRADVALAYEKLLPTLYGETIFIYFDEEDELSFEMVICE